MEQMKTFTVNGTTFEVVDEEARRQLNSKASAEALTEVAAQKQDKWVALTTDTDLYATYNLNVGKEYLVSPLESDTLNSDIIINVDGYKEGLYCGKGAFVVSVNAEVGEKVHFKLLEYIEQWNEKTVVIKYALNGTEHSAQAIIDTEETSVDSFELVGAEVYAAGADVYQLYEDYLIDKIKNIVQV